jgi:hypothetical protein
MSINIDKVAPEDKERCIQLNEEERAFYAKPMTRCKEYYHKDIPVKVGDIINVGHYVTELAQVTRLSKCFVFYKRLTKYRWEFKFPVSMKEERCKYSDHMCIYELHKVYYQCSHRFSSYYTVYIEEHL